MSVPGEQSTLCLSDSPMTIVMAAFPGSRPATVAELDVLELHRQAEAIRDWNAWQRALEADGP